MHNLPPVLKTAQRPNRTSVNAQRDNGRDTQLKSPADRQGNADTYMQSHSQRGNRVEKADKNNDAPQTEVNKATKADEINFTDLINNSEPVQSAEVSQKPEATELVTPEPDANAETEQTLKTTEAVETANTTDANIAPVTALAIAKLSELKLSLDNEAKADKSTASSKQLGVETTPIQVKNENNVAPKPRIEKQYVTAQHTALKVEAQPKQVSQTDQQTNSTAVTATEADADVQNATPVVEEPAETSPAPKAEATPYVKTSLEVTPTAVDTVTSKLTLPAHVVENLEKILTLPAEIIENSNLPPKHKQLMLDHLEKMATVKSGDKLTEDFFSLATKISDKLDTSRAALEDGIKKAIPSITKMLGADMPANPTLKDIANLLKSIQPDLAQANNPPASTVAAQPDLQTSDVDTDANVQTTTIQNGAVESKYTDRYAKSQANDNVQSETSGYSATSNTETSLAKMANAYNHAKSSVTPTQNTENIMSALDKMNEKNPMDFLNHIQNSQSSRAAEASNQDTSLNIKLALQNGRLAQNLPANSMAFQIGKQFNKGNSEFQIRLDPAELGKINVKLTVKQGGDVKAHMVVERNDVFELMQRDARALERALSDAGFEGKNVDIELSLDQNSQNGGTFAENFFDQSNDNNSNNENVTDDDDIEQMVANHMPSHVTSIGIDRKV